MARESEKNLETSFSKEFLDEFMYDAEFRTIFLSIANGESPYKMIEHLVRTKKEVIDQLEQCIKVSPVRLSNE